MINIPRRSGKENKAAVNLRCEREKFHAALKF